ncbi:hypothetical protein ACIRG5_05665 [Lentzea sp. NPDC102401]|uniref:hypothetical protein n=1 Tax=Lentzea sp. NPDC102401 TaxID=3364128 RepID=UPI00382BA262
MFRRKEKPSAAEQIARELGAAVHAPVNKIHAAPTQRHLVESLITRPSGLVAILESVSQCSQLVPPGALGNPDPVEVPISGHNLMLTLINRTDRAITVSAVRAVYRSVIEYDFPAQLCATPPNPTLVYGEELEQSAAHAAEGYRSLEKPHLEIHLDGHRPLIVEALLPDGERARDPAPLTVGAHRAERVVLSPVLRRRNCVGWRLVIRWHEDGDDLHSAWDLLATGSTGWSVTSADGEVRARPLSRFGHWDPVSLWEDGCTSYDEHLGMISTPDPAWLDAVRED